MLFSPPPPSHIFFCIKNFLFFEKRTYLKKNKSTRFFYDLIKKRNFLRNYYNIETQPKIKLKSLNSKEIAKKIEINGDEKFFPSILNFLNLINSFYFIFIFNSIFKIALIHEFPNKKKIFEVQYKNIKKISFFYFSFLKFFPNTLFGIKINKLNLKKYSFFYKNKEFFFELDSTLSYFLSKNENNLDFKQNPFHNLATIYKCFFFNSKKFIKILIIFLNLKKFSKLPNLDKKKIYSVSSSIRKENLLFKNYFSKAKNDGWQKNLILTNKWIKIYLEETYFRKKNFKKKKILMGSKKKNKIMILESKIKKSILVEFQNQFIFKAQHCVLRDNLDNYKNFSFLNLIILSEWNPTGEHKFLQYREKKKMEGSKFIFKAIKTNFEIKFKNKKLITAKNKKCYLIYGFGIFSKIKNSTIFAILIKMSYFQFFRFLVGLRDAKKKKKKNIIICLKICPLVFFQESIDFFKKSSQTFFRIKYGSYKLTIKFLIIFVEKKPILILDLFFLKNNNNKLEKKKTNALLINILNEIEKKKKTEKKNFTLFLHYFLLFLFQNICLNLAHEKNFQNNNRKIYKNFLKAILTMNSLQFFGKLDMVNQKNAIAVFLNNNK